MVIAMAGEARTPALALMAPEAWNYTLPSAEFYEKQKGVKLPCAPVSSRLLANCNPLAASHRDSARNDRSRFLYQPRLHAANHGLPHATPALFPGCLPHAAGISSPCLNAYEQFVLLVDFDQSSHSPAQMHVDSCSKLRGLWPWRKVERPKLTQVICTSGNRLSRCASSEGVARNAAACLVEKICSGKARGKDIAGTFNFVRALWNTSDAKEYNDLVLYELERVVRTETLQRAAVDPLKLVFELELLASYGSLVEEHRLLASGNFGEYWLDVCLIDLPSMRGVELCEPHRLLDELTNLAEGRIAPLLINEFGCVADGNHRLTASWLWNILHDCRSTDWLIEDESFQSAIGLAARRRGTAADTVPLHEALRCLATLSSNDETARRLATLRKQIETRRFDSLPAIRVLEYASLALIGAEYDNDRFCRFDPVIYQSLCRTPGGMLPARACYHFADRIPLPWFYPGGSRSRSSTIATAERMRSLIS